MGRRGRCESGQPLRQPDLRIGAGGPARGRARQFLSAPVGSEVCGPAFTPDNRTFFVAIQHPGWDEKDATYDKPDSRWPDFRTDMPPRPSVVAIYRTDGGKVGT